MSLQSTALGHKDPTGQSHRAGRPESDRQMPQLEDGQSTPTVRHGSHQPPARAALKGRLFAPDLPPRAPGVLGTLLGAVLLSHGPKWTGAWGCTWPPPRAGRGSRTYRGKSKEGDANEGERCGQEPPVPGLGVFVPVTNGRQGDLWDSKAGHSARPGSDHRGGHDPDLDALPSPQGSSTKSCPQDRLDRHRGQPSHATHMRPSEARARIPVLHPRNNHPQTLRIPPLAPHSRAGCGVTGSLSSHSTPVRASHGGGGQPLWVQGQAAARKPRKNQQLGRDGAEQEPQAGGQTTETGWGPSEGDLEAEARSAGRALPQVRLERQLPQRNAGSRTGLPGAQRGGQWPRTGASGTQEGPLPTGRAPGGSHQTCQWGRASVSAPGGRPPHSSARIPPNPHRGVWETTLDKSRQGLLGLCAHSEKQGTVPIRAFAEGSGKAPVMRKGSWEWAWARRGSTPHHKIPWSELHQVRLPRFSV